MPPSGPSFEVGVRVAIHEIDLRRYASAGIVRSVVTRKSPGGWILEVQLDNELLILQRQRGGERVFKSIDTLCVLIESLGVISFEVMLQT